MRQFGWLAVVVLGGLLPVAAQGGGTYAEALDAAPDLPPLFPFKVTHGLPDNLTNVQTWSGPWRPAGADGFIRSQGARFVNDRGPCRFSGTNICFSGCFPAHRQAEQVAADVARFGINLVRLHYVHHQFPPGRKYATPDSFIEPVQLERFDYLFSQLKRRGIYTYFQLNIARKFGPEAGFPAAEGLPWFNNGLDNFEPRMIALQQKYVRDLLGHVNPYTGLAYKDEPAIAMLELANENSVVVKWSSGELDHLPSPYAEQFQGLWNQWLRRQYATTARLRQAWTCRTVPTGEELIADGQFAKRPANAAAYPAWGLQHDGASQGEWAVVPPGGPPVSGPGVARLVVRQIGRTPNMPQFYRRFGVTAGMPYTLTFKLRCQPAAAVSVRVSQDHDPWHVVGFRTTLAATGQWQSHSLSFTATQTDPQVRLVFADFTAGTTIDLADVSLRPGGTIGLAETETLEDGRVPIPKPTGPSRYHLPAILGDFSRFLFEVEDQYFQQMARVVKDEVKAVQPVTGTQLDYGYCYPQGRLDYCDIHSYWCHPTAPGGGGWQNPKMRDYWTVRNNALVEQPLERSTIANLAIRRVLNRPYTVSEYDHPYPNLYAAEGNPMLFAVGAFQDWGAIMHFAWTHSDDYDPAAMSPYFDMKTNSVKQVHFPACYAMFSRGDVRRGPGRYRYVLGLSEQQERDLCAAAAQPRGYRHTATLLKPDAALSLAVFTGLDLTDLAHRPPAAQPITTWQDLPADLAAPDRSWVRNEFGELYWVANPTAGAYFQVDTPKTKVFTGFIRGRSFAYRGLKLTPGRTRLDWATISLVQTSGADSAATGPLAPGRYLLAATGLMQNTGTVLKKVPGGVSTGQGYGGVGGTAPILCEGIPATLVLRAERVSVYALDAAGNRASEVPVRRGNGEATVTIGPEYRTLWYEVVID